MAVAPAALLSEGPASVAPTSYATYVMGQDAIINGYADYANFSSFAIEASLDEPVQRAVKEIAYRVRTGAIWKTNE